MVRGNHDHGAAQDIRVSGRNGFRYLTSVTRPLTRERLTAEDRTFLSRLPLTQMVTLNDTRFMLVHATPRDPLDEYALPDVDFWARRLQGIDANVVCVGHTHYPYVLEVGDKLVINPGSVGQPRDGNPNASYAVIEGTNIELKRAEYPVEDTVRTIEESSLPGPAKVLLSEILRTGNMVRGNGSKGEK
jgi:putative phosphoesterase